MSSHGQEDSPPRPDHDPDDPDKVSAAEFEQMKRDIVEPEAPSRGARR